MTHIFLDHIATTAHSATKNNNNSQNGYTETWRNTLIQPVAIPDISHINVRNTFLKSKPQVWRPDGSITQSVRGEIVRQVKEIPRDFTVDIEDMKVREMNGSSGVKKTGMAGKERNKKYPSEE